MEYVAGAVVIFFMLALGRWCDGQPLWLAQIEAGAMLAVFSLPVMAIGGGLQSKYGAVCISACVALLCAAWLANSWNWRRVRAFGGPI